MSGYDPTPPVEIDALEVTENGTYEAEDGHAYSPVTVSVSGGGGGTGSDPIRFFDYDGTLVASYAEVPDSLPEVPTHDRLTNGTWNYTLAQIEQQLNAVGSCTIGANYDTTSGGTEIDVEFVDPNRLSPYLQFAASGRVVVDWGDGSEVTAVTGSSLNSVTSRQHVYPDVGAYTITITPDAGVRYAMSGQSISKTLLNAHASQEYFNIVYGGLVKAVRLGGSCEIMTNALASCRALTSVSIPNGVTSIGDSAFSNCASLAYVTIPSSVTSLGNSVFTNCNVLDSVSIPSSVTTIGTNTFSTCRSLVSFTIPYGITSIPASMFNTCGALTSVVIPDSVTSIGNSAFGYCYSLASIDIPRDVTSLGDSAFTYCYSIKSITIPSGVTSIGSYAFSNCNSLASIAVPDSVTSLGNSAFSFCTLLTSITIPSGVTSIGGSAFSTCGSLTSITIPSGVTSIGSSTFSSCGGLAELHFERDTPPTLSNPNAFNSLSSDCKFYVPYSSDHSVLEAYKTATNWSTYASRMIEEDA